MSSRILIIDESEHYVRMITIRLNNYGYKDVVCAYGGAEGLEKAKLIKPDLVIIDTRLSDCDGFQLCKDIKTIVDNQPKVILMTGLAEKYSLTKAHKVQADEYVVKTFDCLLLMVAIKKTLSQIEVS